jgi:hypothetical protein
MSRYLLLLVLPIAVFMASCGSADDSTADGDWSAPIITLPDSLPVLDSIPRPTTLAGYTWTNSEKALKEQNCEAEACSEISWHWFTLNPEANQRLRDSVLLFNWYYLTGIAGVREQDLDSIGASFFEEAKKDVPLGEEVRGWSEENSVWPAAATKETFTLGGWVFFFNGGAHGNYASHLENFDASTGSHLKLNNIVAEPYNLYALGEQIFRKQKGIAEGMNLSDAGFTFKEDVFYLPETFGIFPEGLLFIYAPYEIASYAEGEQYLLIPYSLFAEELTTSYQYLAK